MANSAYFSDSQFLSYRCKNNTFRTSYGTIWIDDLDYNYRYMQYLLPVHAISGISFLYTCSQDSAVVATIE